MDTVTLPAYPRLSIDPLAIAESLRADIEASVAEAESQRRLPSGLREKLRQAGALRLFTPVELGGFELDLPTFLTVLEGFGRIDGSVAWNVWNGSLGFSAALLEPRGVELIWGNNSDPFIANSARVTGAAVPADGGFTLSGRWDIVSAVDASDWVALFGVVSEGDGPRFVAPGVPDVRVFYVRRDEIAVLDTWTVSGMRGTGSNTVIADGVFVDEALAPSPFGPSHIDRPLYRIPAFTLASCGCAAVVLGMAQASIDAVIALAATKATGNGQTLQQRSHAHVAVAEADAKIRSARLLLQETASDIMKAAHAGQVTENDRGAFRAAMSHSGRVSRDVVTAMYELGSSSSLYQGNRLERLFRDTHAAAQHALLQPGHLETAGRLMMGLDPGVFVF